MKTYKKVIEKPLLEIRYCSDSESPREWSTIGTFLTVSNRYRSPDENKAWINIIRHVGQIAKNVDNHIELIKKELESIGEKILLIVPVVRFEHGEVIYSIGRKQGFDYSNDGFYIITEESLKDYNIDYDEKEFIGIIEAELEDYNKWVNGYVFEFTLYNKKGEVQNSCMSFYDIEDIKEHLPEEWEKEDLNEYLISK